MLISLNNLSLWTLHLESGFSKGFTQELLVLPPQVILGKPLALRKTTATLLRQAADRIEQMQTPPVKEWVNIGRSKVADWVRPNPEAYTIPRKKS